MKLSEWQKENGVKNKELAEAIRVHPGSIPRYKRKGANPPTSILNRIREATGGLVDADDFGGE